MTSFDSVGKAIPAPPLAIPASSNGHPPIASGSASVSPPVAVVVREAASPRRWTVKGLALAVMCVVLGGLVVMIGVQTFATRDTVLVVAKAVPVGSMIGASDVTTAKITSDPALKPVPGSDRGSVIGKVAMVDLRPGTLITRDELGTSDGFSLGQVLVPLPLKQGQFPARGLSAGESVMIVATPGSNGSNTAGPSTGTPSTAEAKAVITEVGSSDPSTGVTVVDVRVPAVAAVALAQLASTGNLAVLLLPEGG